MKFFATAFAAAAFLISAVSATAGTENPFIAPTTGEVLVAGSTYKVEWKVTKGETVKLTLLKGLSTNLDTVKVLDAKVPNTGSYTWKIDAKLPKRKDYALEIRHGEGEFDNNYTGQFVIDSDVVETTTTTSTKATTTSAPTMTGNSTRTSTTMATTTGTAKTNGTVTSATLSSTKTGGANSTNTPAPGNAAGRSFGASVSAVLVIALGAVAFLG
ncbi:Ser-Thr-rich glycosyl-phosphatidyl-inositol-anchored membrane family-domain-containing protein [Peziza echinospora]|nr:Ser-Thr-rich glycosyl-phosphatidyl-inositol-anchored membrane family-domain-containing protein [Peziza echinospora]